MRYALPLSVLLAAASAAPCVADELSFNDLGPWASGVLSQQLRAAERHMPRGPASSWLPKSGAASYSGVTLGKADVTPSATNVTATIY